MNLPELVAKLRQLNADYESSVRERALLPMSDRQAKYGALQRQADSICGEIMRTERQIINALLSEP